jgi:hypothetical protein
MIDRQLLLFTVLPFFDRHEARVPVARENILAALQSHRRMRGWAPLVSSGPAGVTTDWVSLPKANHLGVVLEVSIFVVAAQHSC